MTCAVWGGNEIKTPQLTGHTTATRNVDITCKAAPSNVYVHLVTLQRLHATHKRRRSCLHIKGNGLCTGFWVIIGYFTALLLLTSIYEDEWSGNEWWICTDLERDRHGQVRLEIRTPKASIMMINKVCDMWPGYLTSIVLWFCGCITAFWASCKRWECVTRSVPAIRSRGKGTKSELFNTRRSHPVVWLDNPFIVILQYMSVDTTILRYIYLTSI